jgi:SAM-dependent methyltransferase
MSKTYTLNEPQWWGDKIPTLEPNEEGVPQHLGGHYNFTNMDRDSLTFLMNWYKARSMIDVGCGTGGMVDWAKEIGMAALGVDGDPNMARDGIITHDYTTGPYVPDREFDLVWCVEFVEHVGEKFIENFMATFNKGKILLLSHAYPYQGGKNHVNLQEAEYWIEKLKEHDWLVDYAVTG